jgi:hypothetical protein
VSRSGSKLTSSISRFAFGRRQRALGFAQAVDDQRADVLARGVEHADELRLAAAIGQMLGVAVLIHQWNRQTVDRIARQFGRERRREREQQQQHRRRAAQARSGTSVHRVSLSSAGFAQRKPRLAVVSAALSEDSMAMRIKPRSCRGRAD